MPALLKDSDEIIGGAAVQWKSWIKGIKQSGNEIGVLTFKGATNYIAGTLDFDIVESFDPNYHKGKVRFFYHKFKMLYLMIKRYRPDYLIQTSASSQTFILMIIAKMVGIHFIHRIASDVHVDEQITKLVSNKKDVFFFRLGLKYSDFILAQNRYQYSKLKDKYPKKNIYLTHNPYELDSQETDILPYQERKYIAWIGNFRKIKNLEALLLAAKNLPTIQFKIAGKEHENLDQTTINSLIQLKKLKNVDFVGYLIRDRIKPFLSRAIALLNTSHNEGFPNTFLEAWSLGVPVITTRFVNPDEIINKNNLGKVAVDYSQLSELIQSLYRLNELEYNKLALNCYEHVKKNHNPKILAERLVFYLRSQN